jgi:thymidylate kinase
MEGLYGITDIDILVDHRQAFSVQKILAENGFIRLRSGFYLRYPSVEGYIGLDSNTGRLAYVHLHYRLILGRFRIKEYSFNWEELILRTRIYDSNAGIFIIEPNLELLILIVRAALKIRYRDNLLDNIGRSYFNKNWTNQFDWLIKRIEISESLMLSKKLLGDSATNIYENILRQNVTFLRLKEFRYELRNSIVLYREYPKLMSVILMWIREIIGAVAFVNRKYIGNLFPINRKTPSKGGALVVFIGADGSGKSTLTKELVSFFSWKLDTLHVYMGAGQGSISYVRRILLNLRKIVETKIRLRFESVSQQGNDSNSNLHGKRTGIIYIIAKILWAVLISWEKQKKLKKAWMSRNQGILVICDRYPQAQIMGFNDGPLLNEFYNHKNSFLRLISRWEMRPYEWAHGTPPDIVVRLNVEPETSIKRDPDLSPEYVKRRIKAVNSFQFKHAPLVEIDANKPFDEVLHEAKNRIWEYI